MISHIEGVKFDGDVTYSSLHVYPSVIEGSEEVSSLEIDSKVDEMRLRVDMTSHSTLACWRPRWIT
jgi:hypothetical protein